MTGGSRAAVRLRRLLLGVAVATATSGAVARSQALPPPPPSPAPVVEPGAELTVWVITLGQGDQVWERFGHNALWIHDAARGTDRTYNWGVFDASDPQFILRFVRGRMRYWMESVDADRLMHFYRAADRSITIQRLALTPAQRVVLRDFVESNEREENKYYWYDYFRDNCSTRLRDAVDRALAGALRRATDSVVTPNTYRSESVRLMEGMALTQAGIAVGLGPLADRRLSPWEEMFVPMRMRDRLREVRVTGPDGTRIPLVAEERQVYVARRPAELQHAPPLFLRYAVVGALVAAAIAALGWVARVPRVGARVPLAAFAGLWALAIGIGGLLLLFLWFGTHHLFAYRNENLLQLNPLAIALVVLAPAAILRPGTRRWGRRLAVAIAALGLLGLALKAVPGFDQVNLPAIALTLPGHVVLAWTMIGLARQAAPRSARADGAAREVPREPAATRGAAIRQPSAP